MSLCSFFINKLVHPQTTEQHQWCHQAKDLHGTHAIIIRIQYAQNKTKQRSRNSLRQTDRQHVNSFLCHSENISRQVSTSPPKSAQFSHLPRTIFFEYHNPTSNQTIQRSNKHSAIGETAHRHYARYRQALCIGTLSHNTRPAGNQSKN